MGTNYYMSTQNKEKRDQWLDIGEYSITDKPDWGYEIHVCKTSGGWKPLFQSHEKIHSLAVYKRMYDEGGWILYDEYGSRIKWKEFEEILEHFKTTYTKIHPNGFDDHEGNRFIGVDFS